MDSKEPDIFVAELLPTTSTSFKLEVRLWSQVSWFSSIKQWCHILIVHSSERQWIYLIDAALGKGEGNWRFSIWKQCFKPRSLGVSVEKGTRGHKCLFLKLGWGSVIIANASHTMNQSCFSACFSARYLGHRVDSIYLLAILNSVPGRCYQRCHVWDAIPLRPVCVDLDHDTLQCEERPSHCPRTIVIQQSSERKMQVLMALFPIFWNIFWSTPINGKIILVKVVQGQRVLQKTTKNHGPSTIWQSFRNIGNK